MPASSVTIRPLDESELDKVLPLMVPNPACPLSAEGYRAKTAERQYRPEWTWLAVDDASGEVSAVAVWWGSPAESRPGALDAILVRESVVGEERVELAAAVLSAAQAAFAAEAAGAATGADADADAGAAGSEPHPPAYHVFVPGDWRDRSDVVAELEWRVAAAHKAGLTERLERLRYEWTPASGVPERTGRVTFHPEPDDEVFVDLFSRVLTGSLDSNSVAEAAEIGAEAQARADVAFYRDVMLGDRSWWFVAKDADAATVGFGLASRNPGFHVVGYLGVLPEHRGRGYVDDILGEITRILAEDVGVDAIRSDTDLDNVPMANAMLRGGYVNFSRRLVFSAA